jgi:hypothetical protein
LTLDSTRHSLITDKRTASYSVSWNELSFVKMLIHMIAVLFPWMALMALWLNIYLEKLKSSITGGSTFNLESN